MEMQDFAYIALCEGENPSLGSSVFHVSGQASGLDAGVPGDWDVGQALFFPTGVDYVNFMNHPQVQYNLARVIRLLSTHVAASMFY